MKFSCTQENLARCLILVSRVASRVGNLPILSNIHINVQAEGIELKATNLEIGITCKLRGKVEQIGEFTVPAKLFTDYITFLPKENVNLELNEQSLKISCGKHTTTLKGMPASDFPLIPPIENGVTWRVSQHALLEGFEQVLFTVSPSETRPEISGAYLALEGNALTMAGTDSYRLAEKLVRAEGEGGKGVKTIVPLRALQELARICGQAVEEGETAKVVVSENQLAVTLPSAEFVTRLIEGQYPDYKAIVPNAFGTQVLISRKELAGAVKAAGLFSKAGVYDVGVEVEPEAGSVTVSALNSQVGEHTSTLSAEVNGNATKIAFNWKYLLEGINALKSERVLIKATDSASPTMLMEEKGDDYYYIVMPIKE